MRNMIALTTIGSLVVSLSIPAFARQGAPASRGGTTSATAEPDGGWPRAYTTATGANLRLYQPQVSAWPGQTRMTAYSAVSYHTKGAKAPALGTIKIEADTSVAVAERLVNFSQFTIEEANFPTLPKDQLRGVMAEIVETVPRQERIIALDRVLASVDASQIVPRNVPGVKADPPAVFFSTTPAALVIFDGDPIWSPIDANDLRFAVNTNWDVFEHGLTKTYFLRVNEAWMTASAVKGPWAPASKLPPSFSKLPADENWKEVKSAVPGKTMTAAQRPAVFISTIPAEMIQLRGGPAYTAVPGTGLLWVNNTESDVFRDGKAGLFYFLVAGRWFAAPGLDGPWKFATLALPEDFKRIPLEHPRSRVLASVPGTSEAIEAVLLAQIPQTATVSRKEIQAPEVIYQGDPQFEPIESTSVSRAVNTDKDIIKVGDLYYMCFQGVWFMSKAATGPWEVTSSVPKEIYEIPVSSPVHNVTYVTVESSTSSSVVFVAGAAYMGMMVAYGCAVWGTGYYYPPYVYYGARYPVYYPHYPTYGYGASYNPWTGAYTRGAAVYGPYGGAGMAARYNPRTGTYSRGAVAYGPYGAAGAARAYNPRTGASAATRQGANAYGSWGTTAVQRGDDWAATARSTNNLTGNTTRVTRTSEGSAVSKSGPQGRSTVAVGDSGDMYAGHDGNVYKKQDGGGWQKYDDGGWSNVDQPTPQQREQAKQAAGQARSNPASTAATPTMGQLERDSAARSQGTERTRSAGYASSPTASQGSYRPSGGQRSGGGRRR